MLNLLPPQWRDPMQWVFVCAASFVRGIGCFMRYAGFFCVVIGMGGSLASLFSWTSEVLTLPSSTVRTDLHRGGVVHARHYPHHDRHDVTGRTVDQR